MTCLFKNCHTIFILKLLSLNIAKHTKGRFVLNKCRNQHLFKADP